MTPWWHWSLFEVVRCVCVLVVLYAMFGPPEGWSWLLVAPFLLLGKYVGSAPWKRWRDVP